MRQGSNGEPLMTKAEADKYIEDHPDSGLVFLKDLTPATFLARINKVTKDNRYLDTSIIARIEDQK